MTLAVLGGGHYIRDAQSTPLPWSCHLKPSAQLTFPGYRETGAPTFGNSASAQARRLARPRPLPKLRVLRRRGALAPPRARRTPALRAKGDRPRASRILAGDCVAHFDATGYVTSAPSREAALGRWQAPGGSRSSTTEDGDERRRRGSGSGAGARGLGDRGGHDPGLGGGCAAAAVRVLFRLRDEGVAAAGGLSNREVPGGGPGGAGVGRGKGGSADRLDPLPGPSPAARGPPPQPWRRGSPAPGDKGLSGIPSASPGKSSVPRCPSPAKLLRSPSPEGVVRPVPERLRNAPRS